MLAVHLPFWHKQVPKYWHRRYAAVDSLLCFLSWVNIRVILFVVNMFRHVSTFVIHSGRCRFSYHHLLCFVLVTIWTYSRFLKTLELFRGGESRDQYLGWTFERSEGMLVWCWTKYFEWDFFPCLVNTCAIRCAESLEWKRGPDSIALWYTYT